MSRRQRIADLRRNGRLVLPSLLQCDFGNLADEIRAVEAAGVRALHLDVMDGHFVPNLSYGLTLVEAIRGLTDLALDVHLMISNPESYIDRYFKAGADLITIHIEATDRPEELLSRIRQLGAASGLAINPPTPLDRLEPCLDCCDLILVMSVMPGFGGQKFDPVALEKLDSLRGRVGDRAILEVDGGINPETIGDCAAAGAEWFVAGSTIFEHNDYRARINSLTEPISQPQS
jgi:ribulose-phosphate 3-epimerase